jgi:hypothetical protein
LPDKVHAMPLGSAYLADIKKETTIVADLAGMSAASLIVCNAG